MIDLHLVSWNRPKMTELVIRTIHRNTPREDFRLVVFDNGSNIETQEMLNNLADNSYIDELIKFSDNMGLEFARQYMLNQATQSNFFIDIDNDCLPRVGWLQDQLDLMYKYEDYAAISQRTQVMIGTGNIFEDTDATGMPLTNFPHPGGSFRLMRTDAVKQVGGWDRKSQGRGAEERFICGKLREAGFGTAFATHIKCLHLFGTRSEGHETDRWGYPKDWAPEATGHSDIWHPVLGSGDEWTAVLDYSGEKLTEAYFS